MDSRQPALLSTPQAAKAAGISTRTLAYAMCADRYDFPWPTCRDGQPYWFSDELTRWRSSAAAATLPQLEDDT